MFVRKFPANDDWIAGTNIKIKEPLSFLIKLETGQTVCQHVDHLRHWAQIPNPERITDWTDLPDVTLTPQAEPNVESSPPEVPGVQRSTRILVPPQRYSPGDFHS